MGATVSAPYYADGGVVLYLGDYREVLAELAPLGANLCLTDPPYGDTSFAWDRSPARGWLAAVRPHLAPVASVWFFGSLRYVLQLAPELAGWQLAQDVVWEKQNGTGFATDRFKRVHEHVVHLVPTGVRWTDLHNDVPRIAGEPRRGSGARRAATPHTGAIGPAVYEYTDTRQARSVIYARNCHKRAINGTQKPELVVGPLLTCSCPPGGLVLDPFAGGGTTLVEARRAGRQAVGVEIREDQCEKTARRLEATRDLFAGVSA